MADQHNQHGGFFSDDDDVRNMLAELEKTNHGYSDVYGSHGNHNDFSSPPPSATPHEYRLQSHLTAYDGFNSSVQANFGGTPGHGEHFDTLTSSFGGYHNLGGQQFNSHLFTNPPGTGGYRVYGSGPAAAWQNPASIQDRVWQHSVPNVEATQGMTVADWPTYGAYAAHTSQIEPGRYAGENQWSGTAPHVDSTIMGTRSSLKHRNCARSEQRTEQDKTDLVIPAPHRRRRRSKQNMNTQSSSARADQYLALPTEAGVASGRSIRGASERQFKQFWAQHTSKSHNALTLSHTGSSADGLRTNFSATFDDPGAAARNAPPQHGLSLIEPDSIDAINHRQLPYAEWHLGVEANLDLFEIWYGHARWTEDTEVTITRMRDAASGSTLAVHKLYPGWLESNRGSLSGNKHTTRFRESQDCYTLKLSGKAEARLRFHDSVHVLVDQDVSICLSMIPVVPT
ncbi:uncharacterized protein I303_108528 [Kwoniella dejecticola CBS 10117]|uniref:Uncharacterized protein n=1 Tax=Kwoniella dejecticola CBS 10117 TaxID=1296121 RepID=A0A1A5ZX61_9TREE|nr:uncharacterized protein I303_07148 [Kwoniella dejecticola CBS 10117]OBR82389.1 hypothetical protein I303_07148 [Kwoniella dejecticola CBS 10117]